MKQYIDKSTLIAEIEKELDTTKKYSTEYVNGKKYALNKILSFISTLEGKEVDLDEEVDNYWGTLTSDVRHSIYFNDFYKVAEHFFELGLKAQEGK